MDYTSESRDLPGGLSPRKRTALNQQDDSDTDFDEKATSEAEEEEDSGNEEVTIEELGNQDRKRNSRSRYASQITPTQGDLFFCRVPNICANLGRPCLQTRKVVTFTCCRRIN